MMVLPDGRKCFKIGLAIQIHYRRVTDTRPPSHVAVAKTALGLRGAGKTNMKRRLRVYTSFNKL